MGSLEGINGEVWTGYSCQYCGQWVPSGTFHSCNTNTPQAFPFDRSQEIIDLLEDIKRILTKEEQ